MDKIDLGVMNKHSNDAKALEEQGFKVKPKATQKIEHHDRKDILRKLKEAHQYD